MNNDQEEEENAIREEQTSKDFARDFKLAAGNKSEASRDKAINKRKFSDSEDEDSHVNKKLKHYKNTDTQNPWKELQFLGKGGFGSVVLVEDLSSGLVCARKAITIRSQSQLEEAELHKKLAHENVIEFFGEIIDKEQMYIYMEYASGGTVHDRIGVTGVPEDRARFFFVQLLEGVKYLHSLHITHRDLKPENLLLSSSDVVKIGDFGLACEFVEGEYLSLECGTMAYKAPEVFKRHYRGEQADIWSCGIILFKLLTARNPWRRALMTDLDFEVWSTSLQLEMTSEMQEENFWGEFSNETFSLFEKILVPAPENRASLASIEENAWIQG